MSRHSYRSSRIAANNRRKNRRLSCESLEHRHVLSTIVALTIDNRLLTFDSDSPGDILRTVAVSGADGDLIGIDYRPATGQLYGATRTSLYSINPNSGAATLEGSFAPFGPTGAEFGFDFNPTVDRLRIVSTTDQNLP